MKRILFSIVLFLSLSNYVFANDFDIVARVNNEVITRYDLENYSKMFGTYFFGNNFTNEEILDSLIDEKLKSEAIKKENIEFDDGEFKYFVENFKKKNRMQNTKEFEEFLKNRFLWTKLVETKIIPNISVSSSETNDALEYLVENPVRTRYNISEITIYGNANSNAKNIAEKLYSEIRENNNFEEIADKFSQYGKDNKGDLGWLDEKDINPDIYAAIKNLQVSAITKPLYFGNYYMIIKLNDKKQEKVAKDTDISRVKYILYNQKINLEINKYIDKLYSNSFIEKY